MRLRELSQTKFALGSDATITLITNIPSNKADELFNKLWKQVFMFERQFSRFLPTSELSVFNRSHGVKTKISKEFKELLISAMQLAKETDGLFNPFILPVLQKAGYKKSAAPGYENDKQIDYADRRVVEVDKLEVGNDWAIIPYGTALDIGGCGKGYLIDRIAETLDNTAVQGYWLSLGGDVATKGVDNDGNKLSLNIQNAEELDGKSDWIVNCPVEYSATATSGTFSRNNQHFDNGLHHIINPRTLNPAITDIRLATVCADTSLAADVLASCAVILGSKKALVFLKKHGVKSAVLQCKDEEGIVFVKLFGKRIRSA